MTEKYHQCPRCDGKRVIDLGEIIECTYCNLEFEKVDIDNIEDKSLILAVSEKQRILDSIPNDTT